MKLKEFLSSFHPKWLLPIGLIGLVLLIPIGNTLAQEPGTSNRIYIPLVGNEQASNEETQQGQSATDGHAEHGHSIAGHISEYGRFTTNNGQYMSWPPQVKYIQNVTWDSAEVETRTVRNSAETGATAVATQNNEVQALLGERYTFISATPIEDKWVEETRGYKVTYFSYSNNLTVEATVNEGAVASVETYSASDFQPPLRQNEVDAAIKIARAYWTELGNERVDALQGFTIQTFQTEGDGGYYDTRMSYVSFHVDETAPPELLTWVDLTNETVVKAAIDVDGVQYEQ